MRKTIVHIASREHAAHCCPNCSQRLEQATGIGLDGPPPTPTTGDLTVCVYCGVALRYAEDGFEFQTRDEWETVAPTLRGPISKLIKERLGHGVLFGRAKT